jgi:hypothetical protein
MKFIAIAASVTLATTFSSHLAAQVPLAPTTARFADIARLAQEGYGDSARTAIARVLARTPETDASFPEALYTAGAVARTGDSMRTVFARIVVDYATSVWADKALVRLAQLEYGFGNMDKVVADVTRLVADYPSSPVLSTGVLWGARAAFSQQKMQVGCDWLTKGVAAAGDDLELKNQLQFAKQSCNVGPGVQYAPMAHDSLRAGPPRTDTATHAAAPPPPPPADKPPAAKPPATKPAPAAGASPWRVQVAAISDKAVIARMVKKIEGAGFKAYTAPGPNGLTKIQAGPFATRAAAVAGLPRVKAAVGGAPIVVPAP